MRGLAEPGTKHERDDALQITHVDVSGGTELIPSYKAKSLLLCKLPVKYL